MIRASIHGRVGVDPVERTTRNGKAMITASVAVNVARSGEDPVNEWISVVAFGAVGELLVRHRKGDFIEAMGSLTRSTFTDREGNERSSWSLTAEAILSVRTVRNESARPRETNTTPRPRARPPDRSLYSASRKPNHGAELVDDGVDDLWRDGLVP